MRLSRPRGLALGLDRSLVCPRVVVGRALPEQLLRRLPPRVGQLVLRVVVVVLVVAVLVGGSLLGVLGALLAIPMAAAVQLVLDEVVAPRQDRV